MTREHAWLVRCLAAAAVLGGALLAVGWVINVPRVTPAGEVVILASHVLLGLGLLGIHLHQAQRVGVGGLVATLLAVLGSRLLTPSVVLFGSLVPATAASLHDAATPGHGHLLVAVLALSGPLMFTGGMLGVGWSTWRAQVLPPSVGLAWMIGIALLFAGAALQLGQALAAVGAAGLAYGFIAAGRRTWTQSRFES